MNIFKEYKSGNLFKATRKQYNRSFLNIIKLHIRFNMQLTKMIFVKWVYSVWFSFLYFMSKFNNKILCNMVKCLYKKYDRNLEKTNFRVYEGRNKFDNGHSKICRVNVSPILSLDEEEWQRFSEEEPPSEELLILKNKVKSFDVSGGKKVPANESGIDLNYLEDMMKRAKDEIKPKSN